MKQTIGNACGTIGILHAVVRRKHSLQTKLHDTQRKEKKKNEKDRGG